MLGSVRSTLAKLSARILLAVLISCYAGTAALASARQADQPQESALDNSETRPRRVAATAQTASEPAAQPAALVDPAPASLQVAYALYDRSISLAPQPVIVEAPRTINLSLKKMPIPEATPGGMPAPQRSPTVASTAPLTVREKFYEGWFKPQFLGLGPYFGAAFNGMFRELNDNDDFKEDTVENFFADSMTRAARSFAFSATSGFYEKALLASIFRQDPRYHRMPGKNPPLKRLVYAATRVLVTQGDRCGCHQFNASFIVGAAGAAATANLWERSERTGPWHTFSRFYTHIYMKAFANIVREFISGQ